MKKLSKLIITQMNIRQIPCYVCAYEEDGKVMELRFEPVGEKSSLGNIYVLPLFLYLRILPDV